MRSQITTHVLDTALGKPAEGIRIALEVQGAGEKWKELAQGTTNGDGRIGDLLPPHIKVERGIYRMVFETASYFRSSGVNGFYPRVEVIFEIRDPAAHYHIPLLLSPYGYSTYRGS